MSSRRRAEKRQRPVAAVLIAAIVVALGVAVIAWELRPGPAAQTTTSAEPEPSESAAGDVLDEEPSPSPAPAGPRTQFADGVWTVGKDLKAGRYKTTVPADVFSCHWERMRDTKGATSSIIEEGLGKPGTRVTVTIKATDKLFKSELCGTWTPA